MIPLSFDGTPLSVGSPEYAPQSGSSYEVETTVWRQNFTAAPDPRPDTNDHFRILGYAHIHNLDDMMTAHFSASAVDVSAKPVVGGAWLIRAVSNFDYNNWIATIPNDGANLSPGLPDNWTGVSGTSVSSFPVSAIADRPGEFMICASIWGENGTYGPRSTRIMLGGEFFIEGRGAENHGVISFDG